MLTPSYIQTLTNGLKSTVNKLEKRILDKVIDRIVARLKKGVFKLSATDKIQLETLRNAGVLEKDIIKELSKATGIVEKEIKKAFKDAGIENDKYDARVFQNADISMTKLQESPYAVRVMQRNYESTIGAWRNYCKTTATAVNNLFVTACDDAYNEVMSGAFSLDEAVKNAVEKVARQGVTFVSYTKNGQTTNAHRDTLETATLRAVRTGVVQATGEISMQRLKENNWDIVLVSSHLGARDTGEGVANHAEWQGKFYSLSGTKYPDFYKATGYGTGEGLCGWNCRHSFGPGDGEFNPYKQYSKEENHEAYVNSQKARAMERAIRKEKRVYNAVERALKSDPNNQALIDKKAECIAKLRPMNEAYRAFCKEHNIHADETRLYVSSKSKVDVINITKETLANAKPGVGTITDARTIPGSKPSREDIADTQNAEWVKNIIGGDITLIPEDKNGGDKLKTPDALYNGGLMEFKSGTSPSSTDSALKTASSQYSKYCQRHGMESAEYTVVVDVKNYADKEQAIKDVELCAKHRFKNPTTVIIRDAEELIRVIRTT